MKKILILLIPFFAWAVDFSTGVSPSESEEYKTNIYTSDGNISDRNISFGAI